MLVLFANGDNDLLVSTYHSWILMDRIKKLAGHGFLYQYAELLQVIFIRSLVQSSRRASEGRSCNSQGMRVSSR